MIDDAIPVERANELYDDDDGGGWKVLTASGDLFHFDFTTRRVHWWNLEETRSVEFGFQFKVKRCEVGKRLKFTCTEMIPPKRLVVKKIWRDAFPTFWLGDIDV